MNVRELIDHLEDMPEDAEVRLAIQPSYPMQHKIDRVVLDGGHRHEWVSTADWAEDGDPTWTCDDEDCDAESHDADARPPSNDKTGDDAEDEGIVYIAEAGQVYEAPYLPGSAANELGWR